MSVAEARAAREAVKAKQIAIDNELFDLARDEQQLTTGSDNVAPASAAATRCTNADRRLAR